MACLKVMLIHVGSAASELRLTQFCVYSVVGGMKRVMPKLWINFTYRKCEENIGEAVEQEEKLCYDVETKL